jgi:two-component system nitrogen regulation response regulator GlnG
MKTDRILVADDEESIRWVLSKALTGKGFTVDLAANGTEAARLFRQEDYLLAIIDIKMPDLSGLDLLSRFHQEKPLVPVIIITAETTMMNAVEAMKRGAFDYITKPFDLDLLDAAVLKAQKAGEMSGEVHRLKEELKEHYHLERALIGQSQPMQEVYKVVGKVAPADVTVLITGESGTGKELVARAIHFNSRRLGKPFLAINCAAIPRELKKGPSPALPSGKPANSNRPPGVPSSSTKSATCPWNFRPSYCGFCRNGKSPAWVEAAPSRWMCASSPPPTRISRKR